MKKQTLFVVGVLAGLVILAGNAFAASASGSITVNVTIVGSVGMTFNSDPSGITLGGSGTSAATIDFGSVQAYGGTLPAGVTRTVNQPTNWVLSTPFDVVVYAANIPSSVSYTLTAQLNTADLINTWDLSGTVITSAAPTTLTAAGTYGSTPYTLDLTIPFSEPAGAVSNTINFVATSN